MRAFYIKHIHRSVPEEIDTEYHAILDHYSLYYKCLDAKLQQHFRLRLYHLLNVVGFASAEFPQVTREMRAVIGSAIVQITFGLTNYLPSRFTNIIVKPHRYMYPGYGEPFLGHIDFDTNTIYFSWRDVQDGFAVYDDAVNVALHEMAHVIEAENGFGRIFTRFFSDIEWSKWAQVAFRKMHMIRSGESRFLNRYGAGNMREMFAVCIETFFERPWEFKASLPEIYHTMVVLLKQDPTMFMRRPE